MDEETLAARKVETLDIASNVKDYWTYIVGGQEIDLTTFKSEKTGRGPLGPGWQVRPFSKVYNRTTTVTSVCIASIRYSIVSIIWCLKAPEEDQHLVSLIKLK